MIAATWPAPETTQAAWDVATTIVELAGTVLLVLAAAALVPLVLALVGRRPVGAPWPDPRRLDVAEDDADLDRSSDAATEVSPGVGR